MGLAMHKACGFLEWWQPPEIETNVVLAKWYWPDGVVCHGGIDAYIQAAVSVGFEETSNPNWEGSAEKVILYYLEDAQKTFKHAAICESPNVCWSKIGRFSDISHRPIALDDVIKFGSGRVYLARRLK
jgi:hypothetical protein